MPAAKDEKNALVLEGEEARLIIDDYEDGSADVRIEDNLAPSLFTKIHLRAIDIAAIGDWYNERWKTS